MLAPESDNTIIQEIRVGKYVGILTAQSNIPVD